MLSSGNLRLIQRWNGLLRLRRIPQENTLSSSWRLQRAWLTMTLARVQRPAHPIQFPRQPKQRTLGDYPTTATAAIHLSRGNRRKLQTPIGERMS